MIIDVVVRFSLSERPQICPTKNGDKICLSENGDNSVTGAGGGVWSHNCGATVPTVSWRETLKGGGAAAQIYLWHSGHEANFYLT